ncbi:MAG: hypothetical protein HRT44_04100 [Bdellovibrionales bacterium]|nr:hypothetical protein [Bdellovibrionales bacterium]NQZ18425.1 hypothetical protein [Bdellovibrionales bacterium]
MKYLLFSIVFVSLTAQANTDYTISVFERPDFSFNNGQLALRPGAPTANYSVEARAPLTPTAENPTLNRRQVITSRGGAAPYRIEAYTSTTSNDMVMVEGGASTPDSDGDGTSEIVVTQIQNRRITARTRCTAQHSVTQGNTSLADVINQGLPGGISIDFSNFSGTGLSQSNTHRELMDCTTVTPRFCQDVLQGLSRRQFDTCVNAMKNIASLNRGEWNNLQQTERNLTQNYTFPFAENFFTNVSNSTRGGTANRDFADLQKYSSFTEADARTMMNLYKDCDVFRYNQPIANPDSVNLVNGTPVPVGVPVEL